VSFVGPSALVSGAVVPPLASGVVSSGAVVPPLSSGVVVPVSSVVPVSLLSVPD
jgi:hypothetical protein